jgi:hypothetical protein
MLNPAFPQDQGSTKAIAWKVIPATVSLYPDITKKASRSIHQRPPRGGSRAEHPDKRSMKCRDHTALFDPRFKEAVTSLDQEPLVFDP